MRGPGSSLLGEANQLADTRSGEGGTYVPETMLPAWMLIPTMMAIATGPSLPQPRGSKAVPKDPNTRPNVM